MIAEIFIQEYDQNIHPLQSEIRRLNIQYICSIVDEK